MNRRSFLGAMLKAATACAILPAATTYVRTWGGVLVPDSLFAEETTEAVITARYVFKPDGVLTVKIIRMTGSKEKEYASLEDAMKAIGAARKLPAEAQQSNQVAGFKFGGQCADVKIECLMFEPEPWCLDTFLQGKVTVDPRDNSVVQREVLGMRRA